MTTGVLCPVIIPQFFLNNGQPAALGSILTQVGGVNTPTYADSALITPLPNPIPLNSRGEVSDASGASKQLFLTPNTVYTFTLSDSGSTQIWQATYVNGVQVTLTQTTIGQVLTPQTQAEITAGVTPTNIWYSPGDIRRYGTNTTPGTTDMSAAFQSAAACNATVTLQAETYLVAGVTLSSSVVFQGQGFGTVILDKTTTLAHGTYSVNIFTATASIDYITFRDLTLDGACAGPSSALDTSEIPMVKITNTNKVTFDRVKLTRYCGAWSGVLKAVSASFWEAIVIQNAARCVFSNCLFTNNHYEMVLIWNAPGSGNEVLVDGFLELNTTTPDAHTSFDINGGHITIVNSQWQNTGSTSQIAIQVPQSVRVANCTFLGMQPGSAAQCNIGQDTFPYNSDVLIENNYFLNANSAAISVGMGSSIVIRGNVIDTPVNYGIKLTNGVSNFASFTTEYPEWPAPSAAGSNSVIIKDNVINAVSNASSISTAIYLHTINTNAGYWFKDVQISGNTVTAGNSPNNTFYGLRVNDAQDITIRDNWLQYTQSGCLFESLIQNARIEDNTFVNVPPFASNDVLWNGAFTSSNVKIRYNQFNNFPVGQNGTVNVFAGTVSGLDIIDNVGIHPTLPVQGPSSTGYVAYQTKQLRVTAAPTAGDFGLNDVVKNVPTTAQPGEYICTAPGSFGSIASCTATGTTPNNFFTASAVAQLHVGMRFTIAGAGPAAGNLTVLATYITGSTVYIDTVISTSVSGAALTVFNPTFVKSSNYT